MATSSKRNCCVFIYLLPARSLLGVLNLRPTETTIAGEKKCLLFVFSISKFESLLFLAFLYYCQFDTFVSGNASARAPVAVQQSFIWQSLCLTSTFCLELNQSAMFYRSLAKLFQLLSQLRQVKADLMCSRSVEACWRRWNALTSGILH